MPFGLIQEWEMSLHFLYLSVMIKAQGESHFRKRLGDMVQPLLHILLIEGGVVR